MAGTKARLDGIAADAFAAGCGGMGPIVIGCQTYMASGGTNPVTGAVATTDERILWGLDAVLNFAGVRGALGVAAKEVGGVKGPATDLLSGETRVVGDGAPVAGDGVDLSLSYKSGWTDAQRAAADAKVKILNDADTVLTTPVRSGTSAASRYRQAGNTVPTGSDVDHMVDLQLGGTDTISNMSPLDRSVNRSLGAQIYQQTKGLQPGTKVNNVKIGDR